MFYTPNPFLHSSYLPYDYDQPSFQYSRALAQQRARRSQYLPDEDDSDGDSEYDYAYSGLGLRERMYLEARKRQDAIERRREEEAARLRELRAQQEVERRRRQEEEEGEMRRRFFRSRSRSQTRSPPTVPITAPSPQPTTAPFPQPTTSPSPSPKQPTPSPEALKQTYTPAHHEAATKIQTLFRIHLALRTISSLEQEFLNLRRAFVPTSAIDLELPGGGVISVPAPPPPSPAGEDDEEGFTSTTSRLAYTVANRPIHAYIESLSRLLVGLDAVHSWGAREVRERRRGIVRAVEAEAAGVERWWKKAAAGVAPPAAGDGEAISVAVIPAEEELEEGCGSPARTEGDGDLGML